MAGRRIQILVLLAMSTLACAGRANVQADEQAIRALLDSFGKAGAAGDVETVMKLYVAEPIKLGPGRPAMEGASAVRAMFTSVLKTADVKTELVANDIRVSGDLAVARGVQTGTATPKAGGPATAIQVKWVAVYARQADGSWRIAYDIWNSDLP
jgi:uncharacterized protein (TIGR02246 family)